MIGFAVLAALLAQATPEQALYERCDREIPWITDGVEIADGTPKPAIDPSVDRLALLEKAKGAARERNRLILWYCMRVPGTHTYRSPILDVYAKVALFTGSSLVDLVRAKFVPLRMACDEKVSAATGIRFPEFIEPGFIVLTPEGRVVHTLDRLRTFNADGVRAALIAVLRKHEPFNAPAGGSVEDLIRGGDDEKAFQRATPDQKAILLRRAGKFQEVLGLSCAPLHKGLALLGLRKPEEARMILETEGSAEALYHLAAIDSCTGKDPESLWRRLAARYPDSPWAWRAASNLVKGRDGRALGPMAHHFEDYGLPPPSRDFDSTVARAVEFLLCAQEADGSWSDARYCYGWAAYMIRKRIAEGVLDPKYSSWPDTTLQPNVFVAVTALSARALAEWRDVAPSRIDAALARAEKYILDDGHLAPDRCELCYADMCRLMYLAVKKDVPAMNRIVKRLDEQQDRDGFWGHEYPSAFATAAVVHVLIEARRAGADVPETMLRRAADALLLTRREGGRQDYRHEPGKPPSSEKNSMGRTASSELALFECGRGSLERVAAGVEIYWKHLSRLEAVRTCDNHADEELAGFFYFNAVFNTLEAARALGEPARGDHLRRFRAQVLALPEPDGSFVDSHELGKSYGTAMALLILGRVRP
jgi:hypothetical protein